MTKVREVRKHFAVLEKIRLQLIFYDIIDISITFTQCGEGLDHFPLLLHRDKGLPSIIIMINLPYLFIFTL